MKVICPECEREMELNKIYTGTLHHVYGLFVCSNDVCFTVVRKELKVVEE